MEGEEGREWGGAVFLFFPLFFTFPSFSLLTSVFVFLQVHVALRNYSMVMFQVLDVETGSLLARLWDARSRPLYHLPNVGFNATDDLVVTDGALWDPRRGVGLQERKFIFLFFFVLVLVRYRSR